MKINVVGQGHEGQRVKVKGHRVKVKVVGVVFYPVIRRRCKRY